MKPFVDLHCHYLPGVDDGVKTFDESQALLEGLARIGFGKVVATPHMRSGMFNNEAAALRTSFAKLQAELAQRPEGAAKIPATELASEHYFDDVFWGRFQKNEVLPYGPGGALLVEFHYENWPIGIERQFFQMNVRGIQPVLAHPERYSKVFDDSESLKPLLDAGGVMLLDLMSLVGRYGRRTQKAAIRLLEEGLYDAACTDCHRPGDVEIVKDAIEDLRARVGDGEVERLLAINTESIRKGFYEPRR